jgi:hypothetical protein
MCKLAKPPIALATDSVSNLPRAVPVARARSAREIRGELDIYLIYKRIFRVADLQEFHLQIKK